MDPARVRVFTMHVMSKFKSFHEALEPFSLKVGLFFMLVMSPFAIIIYHVFFNCLLVEHLKYLHRMFGFLRCFGKCLQSFFSSFVKCLDMNVVCGLQFLQKERKMHSQIFQIPSLPPNVSWYFDLALVDMCTSKQRSLCVSLPTLPEHPMCPDQPHLMSTHTS